ENMKLFPYYQAIQVMLHEPPNGSHRNAITGLPFGVILLTYIMFAVRFLLASLSIKDGATGRYFQYDTLLMQFYTIGFQHPLFYLTFIPIIGFFPYIIAIICRGEHNLRLWQFLDLLVLRQVRRL